MQPEELTLRSLRAAGAAAVEMNSPIGEARTTELVEFVRGSSPRFVVDLGCGRAALLRRLATEDAQLRGLGVDNDQDVLDAARGLAEEEGVADRVEFELAAAKSWKGQPDTVICIGASHAFGGGRQMLTHLAGLVAEGSAIIGDGIWEQRPDRWCRQHFADLPKGLSGLEALAESAGWTIVDSATSTVDEWDDFERRWTDGVRAVGTPEATDFADRREADYLRYRGTLGFGWLQLRRT